MHLNNKKQMANENNSTGFCCCFLNNLVGFYHCPGYGMFGKIDNVFAFQPENIFPFILYLTPMMQRDMIKDSGIDPVMRIASSKAEALNCIF